MRKDITVGHDIARRLCKTAGVPFAAVVIGHKRRTRRQIWENIGREMFPPQTPRIWFHLLSEQIGIMTGGKKRINDRSLMELFKGDPSNVTRK